MKVDYIQHCGSDLTVVNAARVSFDKESVWAKTFDWIHREGELTLKDIKLVQYLARNQHTSPFNRSFLT